MDAPLRGLRVVELARILAGPWIGQTLADLGAEVIKVEAPEGDDTRRWGPPFLDRPRPDGTTERVAAYFHAANRGKTSVTCDFGDAEDLARVKALIAQADVVIENFKVGGLKRFGLDYDSVAAGNPGIVYASVTGFGQDGPRAAEPGYDFLIQGMSGVMDLTGDPEGDPQKVGVAWIDIFTGLYGVVAVQAALAERARSGRGQQVDLSLMDTGVGVLASRSGDLSTLALVAASGGVAAAGVALLFGPTLATLRDDLAHERRERIRVEERSEIAAHLHDGVLQTLALMQNRADDPREVVRLARRQERELRQWLELGTPASPGVEASATLAALLTDQLAVVEDDHGVPIELVCVGDAESDDTVLALVAAVREAALNAVRHAGVERVDVFAEVDGSTVEAFVRDRGHGFDPDDVDPSRRGVRESIVGRIERAGGSAEVRSTIGSGTEVRLRVPLAAPLSGERV